LLFICEKKFIQCNHLAYFLNVLPDTKTFFNAKRFFS